MRAASSVCDAFASQAPLDTLLAHFSSSPSTLALEHGLPSLAPFLGREFRGPEGLREYFGLLAECLSYEDMRFGGYFTDVRECKVSVRGEARFTWSSTGQSWDEVFTYVLQFDDELKVTLYEVWADSGAAYLASRGKLDQ